MWCGIVWCGVVLCGVVWCGVVWCGLVRYSVVWRSTIARFVTLRHHGNDKTFKGEQRTQMLPENRKLVTKKQI